MGVANGRVDQPRTTLGRWGTKQVSEADGGLDALSEAGIARYNAEGTLGYPPPPQSAAQVHAFWTQVVVPDREVDEDELWRAEARGVYYRSHGEQHGQYTVPRGAHARTAFRVTRMLRDAEKLSAHEAQVLRTMPIEIAPDEYVSVEDLDQRWGVSLLDVRREQRAPWITEERALAVHRAVGDEKDRRAAEAVPAGPSYDEVVSQERMRQLARDQVRDERDLSAYGGGH